MCGDWVVNALTTLVRGVPASAVSSARQRCRDGEGVEQGVGEVRTSTTNLLHDRGLWRSAVSCRAASNGTTGKTRSTVATAASVVDMLRLPVARAFSSSAVMTCHRPVGVEGGGGSEADAAVSR
ncbi:hypothetical protein SY2F82_30420 [Streptomyces sp. Y2F8-2]|nr:hypothetical protein SY2F82_30420 [Streptomyces sp. Y2F8-2]